MASFSPEFLATLRQRLRISAVVGRRVKLVKKGREFSGLCPFHAEKSPSFTVNDDKEFYHCFGCGAHGDVIGFVMNTEGLDFPAAVERLAGEAGLELPKPDPHRAGAAAQLTRLVAVTDAAAKWFTGQLHSNGGQAARDYLEQRGVSPASRSQFRLGFAPDRGSPTLLAALKAQGFTVAEIVAAGLAVETTEPNYQLRERFRERIIFPITNPRGQVIGFGGRALGDFKPKYLNSPETALFSKGSQLYGYDLARAAAKTAPLLVVEGYLDVIALHPAGFNTAVAPLGTALTAAQLEMLWRVSLEPILCFDGDSAGKRAADRAAFNALELIEAGRSLRFVTLPQGQDPDELTRSPDGINALRGLIARAVPLYQRVFDAEVAASPVDTPERKADLKARLRARVSAIKSSDIRYYYQQSFKWLIDGLFNRGKYYRDYDRANIGNLSVDLLFHPLLTLVIRYPQLGSEYLERLSAIVIGNNYWAGVRDRIIDCLVADPTINAINLESRLNLGNSSSEFVIADGIDQAREILLSLFNQIERAGLASDRRRWASQTDNPSAAWDKIRASFSSDQLCVEHNDG
ncbi:MAG: DNA primase [Candidatus Pacebacteria bacterium]|nr:DNA primase [Candidatus Paceibacterota bacterium]